MCRHEDSVIMQTFAIKSSHDDCTLEFFDRVPHDPAAPIESFFVKISRVDLSAVARVYAGYPHSSPTLWLCELAQNWMGWYGERVWESLEGELTLSAKNDRRGHIAITVTLRSGHYDYD